MVERLEQENSPGFDPQRYLGIARRRYFHFLIPLFVGWSAVWTISWVLPPIYQSSTLILVEQPTMPKNYVTPNINEDLQQRLQSITQQILSRTRLIHIIEQYGLYNGKHAKRSSDEKVEIMRKDIGIELVRDVGNQITSFNVSYKSRDPHAAQQITGELTNLFINENLEARQQQSQSTTHFLEDQLAAAQQSLAQQEDKVRQFKGQHIGEMPDQVASNLQILAGLQGQLQNQQDSLNSAKQQRVYLQTLADQDRTLRVSSQGSDDTAVGLPALDNELTRLKAQLADLSSHYTNRHPDVRKLRERIAQTQKARDQVFANMKAHQRETKGGNAEDNDEPANADHKQEGAEPQIQGQLRSNQIEITNREHAIANLNSKIELYQAHLAEEPIREQQLADLNRGYEESKANYAELLKKKNDSAMATSMELLQQGERFRIMDPPSFPQKPDFPNRLKFCGIGVGVGLALGLVVVGAFEMIDDRLHSAQEIRDLVAAEVIGEIPSIEAVSDAEAARRKVLFAWASAAVVLVAILVGSAFSYLRG